MTLKIATLTIALGVFPSVLPADIYQYQGPHYTTVNAPYTTSEALSGEFTITGTLGDSLNEVSILNRITAWTVSDGQQTFCPTCGGNNLLLELTVSTNSSGKITDWFWDARSPNDSNQDLSAGPGGESSGLSSYDQADINSGAGGYGFVHAAGSFTDISNVTPEPGYGVLALVLTALIVAVRSRKDAGSSPRC